VLIVNKQKSLLLLSVLAIAAVMSGFAITAYATENDLNDTELPDFPRHRGFGRGRGHRQGGMFGPVEVSEEYQANVIAITENDEDVKALLADGYTIAGVKPMIKPYVDADGDVTVTATTAIVKLINDDSTTRAAIMVDLNTNSVTQIRIMTQTLIEKDVGSIEAVTP
jgi:hypothetical protein